MAFIGDGPNVTNLNANNLTSGTVATARLGSGTASSSTFLRGDNTWATVSGGVTSLNGQTGAITNTNLNAIGSYVTVFTTNTGNTFPVVGATYDAGGLYTYSSNGLYRTLTYFGLSGTWRVTVGYRGGTSTTDPGEGAPAVRIS